jgi:FtsP/CotA-like multicopper oxidase with cupredoxin domain
MRPAHPAATLLSAAACAALAGCLYNGDTKAATSGTSGIPAAVQVPDGFVLSLKAQANGVQIYQCSAAKDDASHFEWTFEAPQAELSDGAGSPIGRHYAGPTWDAADGSSVVGSLKAKDDGPDPTAVPWLLLAAKSNAGEGVFSNVQYIQRLYTSGGKAPAEGCDQSHAGNETSVPYKASYYFYSPIP